MTAKEMKEQLKTMCPNCDGSGIIANGVTKSSFGMDERRDCIETGTYIEWEPEQCEWCYHFDKLLNDFCAQLCQEQREICSRQVSGWPDNVKLESEIEEDVLNAKMPEL